MNSAQIIIASLDASGTVLDAEEFRRGVDMLRLEFPGDEESKVNCLSYLTAAGMTPELAADIVYRYLNV